MNARRALVALLLIAAAATVWTTGASLGRMERDTRDDELLYLPNGVHLRALGAGHDGLLADLIYIWAIQYYSDYERRDRYRYVEHVFGDVIAELDPHYVDAYWIGALIMIVEGRDVDGGLRILDKGAAHNPDSWILPYLAGWECYRVGRFDDAARYFRRAAAVPDAPIVVRRMEAGMVARGGDVEQGIRAWREVHDDPAADEPTRRVAARQIRELVVRRDVGDLERAIDRFRSDTGAAPPTLDELARRGYVSAVPLDPDGRPYRYDPAGGRVSPAAGRVLGGS